MISARLTFAVSRLQLNSYYYSITIPMVADIRIIDHRAQMNSKYMCMILNMRLLRGSCDPCLTSGLTRVWSLEGEFTVRIMDHCLIIDIFSSIFMVVELLSKRGFHTLPPTDLTPLPLLPPRSFLHLWAGTQVALSTGMSACSIIGSNPVTCEVISEQTWCPWWIRWAISRTHVFTSSKTLTLILHPLSRPPRQTIIRKAIPLCPRQTTSPNIVIILTDPPGRILR